MAWNLLRSRGAITVSYSAANHRPMPLPPLTAAYPAYRPVLRWVTNTPRPSAMSWIFRQATRNGTPCCAAAACIEPVCFTASRRTTHHALTTTFSSLSRQQFERGRITCRPPLLPRRHAPARAACPQQDVTTHSPRTQATAWMALSPRGLVETASAQGIGQKPWLRSRNVPVFGAVRQSHLPCIRERLHARDRPMSGARGPDGPTARDACTR